MKARSPFARDSHKAHYRLQLVRAAVQALPLDRLELADAHVTESVIDPMFTAADVLVRMRNPLTFKKLRGARSLDDVNAITSAFGQAMFQLGVAYGRRLRASESTQRDR